MFSDILPTGYETGVLKGQIKLGDTVAIVGAGPIGLATLLTAQFYSPSTIIVIDRDPFRLEVAKRFGASLTININDEDPVKAILSLTNQKDVDVVIEAVGTPEAFDICQSLVAPGGNIANIGVHGKSVNLHLETLWHQNMTLTTALVDTSTIPILLKTFQAGKLEPSQLITHHFDFKDILKAYEVFGQAEQQHALKVIIKTL
jgi:alcohol dehydrogenase